MSKHLDREERLEKQYQRLGTRDACCVTCAHDNPFALQLHHPAGEKHHDDTVIECANCHLDLSNQQLDHVPRELEGKPGMMITIGRYLVGLADMFAMLARTLREFGTWLIDQVRSAEVVA